MIDAIIRGTLGEIGSVILDFYIQNSLWINSILLIYVLILIFSKRAYSEIKQAIFRELINQYGEEITNKNERYFKKVIENSQLNWDSISRVTWIPFFSVENSLVFKIKSVNALKTHFTPNIIHSIISNEKK